jgi:hypothetical protein
MASKVGEYFHCCLFACCPGGCWGDTEQVVAQWWHPVASGIALDMLHWAMLHVSLQHIHIASKMAFDRGTFFVTIAFLFAVKVDQDHVIVNVN